MDEQYVIQCEHCGATYDEAEENCPYCGQPRPEEYQEYYEDEPLSPEDEVLPYHGVTNDEYLAEDDYGVDEFGHNYLPADYLDEYAHVPPSQDEYDPAYHEYAESPALEPPLQPTSFFTWWRMGLGCLTMVLCLGFYFGGLGALATYQGLKEQATEAQAQVKMHYERGQAYLESKNFEKAIAEFQYALSLDPTFTAARQALEETRKLTEQESKSPTPTSASRSTAAGTLFAQAETEITQRKWTESVQTLSKLRDLDLSYQAQRVSEMFYTANYQLGLQTLSPDRLEEAKLAFERALAERPDDPKTKSEVNKTTLYLEGQKSLADNKQAAVERFNKLYQLDPTYLDVEARLLKAYQLWGDELATQKDWCQAEIQYTQAMILKPDNTLRDKADNSGKQCKEINSKSTLTPTVKSTVMATAGTKEKISAESSPTPTAVKANSPETKGTATITPTATSVATPNKPAAPAGGSILYSVYNKDEREWHIIAVAAGGGAPKVLVKKGIMPAVSRNGRWLLYRSEASNSEGLHLYDLTNGEDSRVTIFRQDILPRWGADEGQFLFTAKEPGSDRWQIHLAVTNNKTPPKIVLNGRTPAWGMDGTVAFQGKTVDGNNPGIYLSAFMVGEPTRLTMHESDRSPDFSPDSSQIVYMSTQSGNWDIYVMNRTGGTPRQLTTYPGNDGLPVWSPDGTQIAYVSDTGGSWAIYTINATGGTPTKVINWDSTNRQDWLMEQLAWTK